MNLVSRQLELSKIFIFGMAYNIYISEKLVLYTTHNGLYSSFSIFRLKWRFWAIIVEFQQHNCTLFKACDCHKDEISFMDAFSEMDF